MDDSLRRWLQLREAADAEARSTVLTRHVAAIVAPFDTLNALDLATGTGSNIRYLAERLQGRQRWLAVDENADLLEALLEEMEWWGRARGYECTVGPDTCLLRGSRLELHIETLQLDLGVLHDHVLFAGRHLVTASALLDLVSEPWLRDVAGHCRAENAAVLFSLTYNGRSVNEPCDPDDEVVLELFNRHQKTDKGLGGPAAGPDAAAVAEQCFADAGFVVHRAASDWNISATERDMQRFLIDGWAHAAREIAPRRGRTITAWHRRRIEHLNAGQSRVVVGHDDLAAWPPRAT
jgi:hypothetical protein